MPYISTLTQKGQVTIPIEIRKFLGLSPSDQVAFLKREREVIVKPAVDFLSLKGTIKTRKKYSDRKADEALKRYIAKVYEKEKETY